VTGQINQATAATLGINPVDLLQLPSTGMSAPPPAPTAPMKLSQEAIRNVQMQLKRFGFYAGAVDGNWGPGTQSGLSQFQQGRGLQVTGKLTPQTVTALGLDPYTLQPR
jgi:peptidoglycan hydrolase-like protein with peptidoglycan-binding domain